jgi:type IV pilus assembly protein PilB
VLLEQELISTQEAAKINGAHLSSRQSVATLIKEADLVSEKQLVKAQAKANNIDYIDLAQTGLSPEAIDKIEESVARRYQLLPVSIDHDQQQLQVAMANPLDVAAVNFVSQKTGYQVQAAYALPSEIKRLINQRYAQDLSSNVSKAIQETSSVSTHNGGQAQSSLEQITSSSKQGGLIRAAPINKIVSAILEHAMEARASDVHIEPQTEKTRVRYRVDGVLHEKLVLPKKVHSAVASRIKILSDLKIDEKRVPQDGRFGFSAGGQEVDLRVSTCPTIHGEKIVMRLLEKNSSVPSLSDLGISGRGLQVLRKTIHIPHGIILITGPTGSGKTTTLYSILNIINTAGVNIITLEDPVEYQIKGVSQVQVNPQAGLTFANGLRSFLRQDPDIIMVGEIRDKETADLAVQASLTGHLVFSTLHTNSAAGALPRLMDMGVEPFLLSSSVILSMGQRVVRRINPEYKEAYQPDQAKLEDIQQVLGDKLDEWCQQNETSIDQIKLYRTKQDRPQTEPEYKGMIGIFEVMPIDERLEKLIDQEATAGQLEEQATATGMNLMKQDGYLKALDGVTTIEEVLRVAEVVN